MVRVKFVRTLKERVKEYGSLQMMLRVVEEGHPLQGQVLRCFFPVPDDPRNKIRSVGTIAWPEDSKYAMAWTIANGSNPSHRSDRLPPSKFKGKVFLAKLEKTSSDPGSNGSNKYKICDLVRLIPATTETESCQNVAETLSQTCLNSAKKMPSDRCNPAYDQQEKEDAGPTSIPGGNPLSTSLASPSTCSTSTLAKTSEAKTSSASRFR